MSRTRNCPTSSILQRIIKMVSSSMVEDDRGDPARAKPQTRCYLQWTRQTRLQVEVSVTPDVEINSVRKQFCRCCSPSSRKQRNTIRSLSPILHRIFTQILQRKQQLGVRDRDGTAKVKPQIHCQLQLRIAWRWDASLRCRTSDHENFPPQNSNVT